MDLDIIISAAGIILAQVFALWRMHAMQTRRIDQLNRDMVSRTDQLRSEMIGLRTDLTGQIDQLRSEMIGLRTDLTGQMDQVRSDLTGQNQDANKQIRGLAESIAKVDSRLSRVEGLLQPRPWAEFPPEPAGAPS